MIKRVLFFMFITSILGFVSCDNGTTPESIVGTWDGIYNDLTCTDIYSSDLEFSTTYWNSNGDVVYNVEGTYTISENVLTVIYTNIINDGGKNLQVGDTLIASFVISGDTLTLTTDSGGVQTFTRR